MKASVYELDVGEKNNGKRKRWVRRERKRGYELLSSDAIETGRDGNISNNNTTTTSQIRIKLADSERQWVPIIGVIASI